MTSPAILSKRRKEFVKAIELYVTSKCMLACKHCCIGSGGQDTISKRAIYELLKEAKMLDVNMIHVTGGEPFLRKDILDIIDRMLRFDYYISLVTSGCVELPRAYFRKLCDFSSTDKFELLVSLDGDKKHHEFIRGEGTYDKALSFISNVLSAGIRVRIITCVSMLNINILPSFVNLIKECGVRDIIILYFTPTGRGEWLRRYLVPLRIWKNAIEGLSTFKKDVNIDYERCFLSKNQLKQFNTNLCKVEDGELICISSDGIVFPCILLKEYKIGKFKKGKLVKLWEDAIKVPKVLRHARDINCEDRMICKGGCVGFFRDEQHCDVRCEREYDLYPICPLIFNNELIPLVEESW